MLSIGLRAQPWDAFAVEREEHLAALVVPAQRGVRVEAVLFDALLKFAIGAVYFLREGEAEKGGG